MRGDLILKILTILKDGVIGSGKLIETFLISGYGASYLKMYNNFYKLNKRNYRSEEGEKLKKAIHVYNSFIYKLKKDGLIIEKRQDNQKFFKITNKGLNKIKLLLFKKHNNLPDINKYKLSNSNNFVIITFDIPEKYKRKRNWLRRVLYNLNFKMLQKSVWIGKTKIPEELIGDFKNINILEYIEILEITKKGTIKGKEF